MKKIKQFWIKDTEVIKKGHVMKCTEAHSLKEITKLSEITRTDGQRR